MVSLARFGFGHSQSRDTILVMRGEVPLILDIWLVLVVWLNSQIYLSFLRLGPETVSLARYTREHRGQSL